MAEDTAQDQNQAGKKEGQAEAQSEAASEEKQEKAPEEGSTPGEATKEQTSQEEKPADKPEAQSSEAQAKEEKEVDTSKLSDTAKKVVEMVENMKVLELAELVKVLEEKFGVSAAAPVAAAAPASGNGESGDEKNEFNVVLAETGPNKIGVIKAVRELVEMGLKEAKDLVEGAPKTVKEGVKKEEAQEMKKKLEAAGAKVELQ